MKATILAIGTELTLGQTLNSNAAWISKQLSEFGIATELHLTVPDDKKMILNALDFCKTQSSVIFVTGGLGPTTDDFTRDVISEWTKSPLIFDEKSWLLVQEKLTSRGVSVKEVQKQQCFFPKDSQTLINSYGIASGFHQKFSNTDLFVLPGPPKELQAIWKDHITVWLSEKTLNHDKMIQKGWDIFGLPESDVAALVEPCLAGRSNQFPLTVGYRVHLPYVEVKVVYPESAQFTCDLYVKKINQALAPYTALKDFQDIADLVIQPLQQTEFAFYDFVTQGWLHQRLCNQLNKMTQWLWRQNTDNSLSPLDADFFSEEENFIALLPLADRPDEILILAEFKGRRLNKTINLQQNPALANRKLSSERQRQCFTELALLTFHKHLLS